MVISSINQAIIAYIISQLKEGNLRCCENLGFNERELREINELSTDEIHHLSNSSTPFMSLTVNHDLLKRMLVCAQKNTQSQKLFDRALTLGASIELMDHYFGSSSGEVSERRRLLGQRQLPGRKLLSSPEKSNAMWYRWKEVKNNLPGIDCIEALDALMLIAEELEMNLTSVWKLAQEWDAKENKEKEAKKCY